MEYHHTQTGLVIIALVVIAIALLLYPYWVIGSFHPIQLAVIIVLVITLALFYSLSVEIKNKTLVCRFGIGFIQKNIPLSEIKEVRAVRNPWYSGWGIRWRPGQYWLWNVSGYLAVELVFKDGRCFRIGTDEPESLIKAIESNKTGA